MFFYKFFSAEVEFQYVGGPHLFNQFHVTRCLPKPQFQILCAK